MQVDRGVPTQELGDLLGPVRRQVVSDHMDFLGRRLIDDNVGQKGDKLCRGVPRRSFAQHLAGFGIECSVQRWKTAWKSDPALEVISIE